MNQSQTDFTSPKDAFIRTLNDFSFEPVFIDVSECLWKQFELIVSGFPMQITTQATVGSEKSSCGESTFSSWGNCKKI